MQPLKIFQSEKELTQPTVHIIYSEVVQNRVPDVTKTNPNKYREHQLQASLYSPIDLFPFLGRASHAEGHRVGFQIYRAFIIVTSILTSFIGHTTPFHVMFLESQPSLGGSVFKARLFSDAHETGDIKHSQPRARITLGCRAQGREEQNTSCQPHLGSAW